LILLIIP